MPEDVMPVVRFCPKCGAKVKGPESSFLSPQNCPNCKTHVLFWDVSKESIGDIVKSLEIKPLVPLPIIVGGIIATIVFFLFSVLFFVAGFVTFPFLLALAIMIAGGYGLAIFFGQQHKLSTQSSTLKKALQRLEDARDQQISVAMKYTLLQQNIQQLTDNALRASTDAQSRYESKLQSLEAEFQSKTQTERHEISRLQGEAQEVVRRIAIRYVDDTKKYLMSKLTSENFTLTKDRFLKTVDFCSKAVTPYRN